MYKVAAQKILQTQLAIQNAHWACALHLPKAVANVPCHKALLHQLDRCWVDTSTCINPGVPVKTAGKQVQCWSSSASMGPFLGRGGGRRRRLRAKGRRREGFLAGGTARGKGRARTPPHVWSQFRLLREVWTRAYNFAGADPSSSTGLPAVYLGTRGSAKLLPPPNLDKIQHRPGQPACACPS